MMKHQTMKMHQTLKEEYDIWAMEMEHYLEYIDNDVWKVIQNGNSKKRISTGKDDVIRILPLVTDAEIQAIEKERKAKNILLMAIPNEHMRRFHRMDLIRIVMRKHGMNEPEDEFEKVLWEYLKKMFEEPLGTDSIWSLPERKYPLSAEVCKAMLDKKLQEGKPDEDCYKHLKMMKKQAGIRKHKDWLVQEQTALGKDFLNPLMADNLPKIIWLSTYHIWSIKSWLAHKVMDCGKGCGKTITSP
ncbi:hypothetical protein Tco_1313504 [Tanacetum coccineum]